MSDLITSADGRRYTINPAFSRPFARDPFLPERKLAILSLFAELAQASSQPRGQRGLVLASSANDHKTAFNSCAVDVELALRGGSSGLDAILSSLASLTPTLASGGADQPALMPEYSQANPHVPMNLHSRISWVERCLTAYRDKRKLFLEGFEDAVGVLRTSFQASPLGRRLWAEYFDRSAFFNRDEDPAISSRMKYLDFVEQLTWSLLQSVWSLLESVSILAMRSKGADDRAVSYAEAYNVLISDNSIIYGRYFPTKLDGEGIREACNVVWSASDAVATVRSVMALFERALHDVIHFFEIFLGPYEAASHLEYKRFVPASPSDSYLTVAGFRERRLKDQFVLFFDMTGSKASLQTSSIKDWLNEVLIRHRADGVHFWFTTDDAFVAASASWHQILALVNAVCERVAPLRFSSDGFGGLKLAINFGDIGVVSPGGGDGSAPKDLESQIIPAAAYLAGTMPQLAEELFGDPLAANDWIGLTAGARAAIENDAAFVDADCLKFPREIEVKGIKIHPSVYRRPSPPN